MRAPKKLTRAYVRSLLDYDPDTGQFHWKRPARGTSPGRRAGCRRRDGYVVLRIDQTLYLAHRIAWLWFYGRWPRNDLDHANGIRDDNRIANLRDVDRSTNLENQRLAHPASGTGTLGVTLSKDGRFLARIQVNKRTKHLGSFGSREEAYAAYLEAKRKYHAGCTI